MYPDCRKGYDGWHLTADDAMSSQLCAAIDRMLSGSVSGPQMFPVSPVTRWVLQVPNYRTKARSAQQLVVKHADNPRHFSLNEQNGVLTLTAGGDRLRELREHIKGITQGRGEFGMGPADGKRRPRDQILRFWWMVQQRT